MEILRPFFHKILHQMLTFCNKSDIKKMDIFNDFHLSAHARAER